MGGEAMRINSRAATWELGRTAAEAAARHWPLSVTLTLFALVSAALYASVLVVNAGVFVYTLDDPYIFASIAKNFAAHGVWGVTSHEFTPANSSLLWPFALSIVYAVTGTHADTPFWMAAAASVVMLAVTYGILQAHGVPRWAQLAALLAVAFGASLLNLAFSGMGHALHALLAVSFGYAAARWLADDAPDTRSTLTVVFLALFATAARYESAFLVAAFAGLALTRGRWAQAAGVSAAAALPVAAFGAVSLTLGWFFVSSPAKMFAKTPDALTAAALSDFLQAGVFTLTLSGMLAVSAALLAALTAALAFAGRRRSAAFYVCAIGLFTVVTHSFVSLYGAFFRYEAYIVAYTVVAAALAFNEGAKPLRDLLNRTAWASVIVSVLGTLAGLAVIALGVRVWETNADIVAASHNIYDQQYRMAMWLRDYDPNAPIVANDIGAITFYADPRLVDVVGLGSRSTAHARASDTLDSAFIDAAADEIGAEIAILYAEWLTPGSLLRRDHAERYGETSAIPAHWTRFDEWTVDRVVTVGGPTVVFYAIPPTTPRDVRERLSR